MLVTSRVGPDSVRAITRVRVSARAGRFAKEVCGCAAACAKRLGPSQRRKQLFIGFVSSASSAEGKQTRDDRGGAQSLGSSLTTFYETRLVTATWDPTNSIA